MDLLYRRWEAPRSRFGDLVVISFLIVQCLDGVFTYLGVRIWGPEAEANPLISSAVAFAGRSRSRLPRLALSFGIMLHLRRVHNIVALLTFIYVAVAILPWTALFLTN